MFLSVIFVHVCICSTRPKTLFYLSEMVDLVACEWNTPFCARLLECEGMTTNQCILFVDRSSVWLRQYLFLLKDISSWDGGGEEYVESPAEIPAEWKLGGRVFIHSLSLRKDVETRTMRTFLHKKYLQFDTEAFFLVLGT